MSVFGEIEGYPEGYTFQSREEVRLAGLHRYPVHGISGGPKDGVDAIVLNQGYEDDEDYGDLIIYTGQGGRDDSGRQEKDQQWITGNAGLRKSWVEGYPVRVIRGPKLKSDYAPKVGYRYDGLYFVEHAWEEVGKSGFRVTRFHLQKASDSPLQVLAGSNKEAGTENPGKKTSTSTRVVRDPAVSKEVKERYDYHCQVCGIRLEAIDNPYAEAAHIRPLGGPHDGPDVGGNVLCLCPNHHKLLDFGSFIINDDLTLNGLEGSLRVDPSHELRLDCLAYHRGMFPK